jgi:hypothetical protein
MRSCGRGQTVTNQEHRSKSPEHAARIDDAKLLAMRLYGMVEALKTQEQDPGSATRPSGAAGGVASESGAGARQLRDLALARADGGLRPLPE